jgi:nucleotide-binding universal stress UspA family protein
MLVFFPLSLRELRMFQRILVPTDGSELSAKAVHTAVQLAQKLGGRVEALSITDPYPYSPLAEAAPIEPQSYLDAMQRLATQRLQAVASVASAAGVPCETTSLEAPQPWRGIVDHASASGADLIVMASHGRKGVSALLLGSETQKVLTHSAVPVLVVR